MLGRLCSSGGFFYSRATVDSAEILAVLPHRFPFLFVDRVVEVGEDTIIAEHLISHSSPILQGHFPGHPILPGVVQVEAMAQAAVVLANKTGHFDPEKHHCYFIGIEKAKFRAAAVPGEVLSIRVKATRLGRVGRFEGKVYAGEELKSTATFTAIIDKKEGVD